MTILYKISDWDSYAESHLSVLPSVQLEVYRTVARYMRGKVADFGCGTARITPFLVGREGVSGYVGVDYAQDMVAKADWLLEQLGAKDFSVLYAKIEEVSGYVFDSALSINSYYTWPDPLVVLSHISSLLKPGAPFILVTPNPTLDMRKLAQEADKELLGHPHYPAFRQKNLELAGNEKAVFVGMDTLVRQLQASGFRLVSCHQDFYLGGLNFIHAEKA
ncbi:MAG: class I SAM-dependent methyltransferase [Thiothrix sp.]